MLRAERIRSTALSMLGSAPARAARGRPTDAMAACADCLLRARCTGGVFRAVSRLENEAVPDRMQVRMDRSPDLLKLHRETVERPFGSIKQWMNQGAFLMKGLPNVCGEFSLTAFAYNLRRAITIVGVQALIEAVSV